MCNCLCVCVSMHVCVCVCVSTSCTHHPPSPLCTVAPPAHHPPMSTTVVGAHLVVCFYLARTACIRRTTHNHHATHGACKDTYRQDSTWPAHSALVSTRGHADPAACRCSWPAFGWLHTGSDWAATVAMHTVCVFQSALQSIQTGGMPRAGLIQRSENRTKS